MGLVNFCRHSIRARAFAGADAQDGFLEGLFDVNQYVLLIDVCLDR